MATRPYWLSFGSSAVSGLAPTFVVFVTTTGANATPPSITEPGSKGLYKFDYDASLTQIAFVCWGATTSLSFSDQYVQGVLDPYDTFGVTLNAAYAAGVTSVALGTTSVALGTTAVALGTTGVAIGLTGVAIGTSNIALGTTNVALGTTAVAGIGFMGQTLVAIGNTVAGIGSIAGLIGDTSSLIGDNATDPTTVFGFLKRALETREGDETYTKATGVLTIYDRTGATLLRTQTIAETANTVTRT
jgi:hypothetical protein